MPPANLPHLSRRTFVRLAVSAGAVALGLGHYLYGQLATRAQAAIFRGPPKPLQPPTVWSGGVTTDGAVVKARIQHGVRARILVAVEKEAPTIALEPQPAGGASDGIATFRLAGLKPETAYRYSLELEGRPAPGFAGQFRTFPAGPASFSFAFASCARTGSAHPVFATIQRRAPLFFLHLGDLHYENIDRNDPAIFREAYDAVFGSPAQAALYRSTPLAYVWDDHDFGPDGSDSRSPSRTASRLTYREYIPHYPLPAGAGDAPIYQAFTVGRARFLMLDCRSERSRAKDADGPKKSLLGAAQKTWLKQELLAAKESAALIFLVSSVPWIGPPKDKPGDGWAAFATERSEIAEFLKAQGLAGKVCILCGDAHMLAADSGINSERAMPVLHGGSLDKSASRKGGPYSEGPYLPKRGEGCFAWVEVRDEGARIAVSYTGRNHLDEVKVKLSFAVAV